MKAIVLLACALAIATPAAAQTVEELQAQLEAQTRINELLKQRIRTLEVKVAAQESDTVVAPAPVARPTDAPKREARDPEEDRALERALVRRGRAVLAPYVVEVTPSLLWSHSGSGGSSDDFYAAALDARVGLPSGWMVGGQIPLVHRSTNAFGDNTGLGDVSVAVWKEIMAQDGTLPSLVGSIRYTAPTGEDFSDTSVSLGSGFHRIVGRLSAVKSVDPIAFYGGASYAHTFTRSFDGVEIDPSGIFGVNAGATLAVTPDISVSAGVSFAFADEPKIDGSKTSGSGTTVGVVDLGVGVVLTKDLFLNFTGAFGVTDDSPDVTLGVSLPVRF
jgi:hypothetical protein